MRKVVFILPAFVVISCTRSLSDEQRKAVKEDMAAHKITRVTDAEITEAAFASGRSLVSSIEKFKGDSARIDSMISANEGKIRWLVPGSAGASAIEQQLIDAYIIADAGGQIDNVQKIRGSEGDSDSLLYSKPVLISHGDKGDELVGVWNIWLSRKQLIRAMNKK